MNKLRDVFYDKNDILVAVLIVAVAALIILFKVNSIMEYPATLVADMQDSTHEQVNYNSSDDDATPEDTQDPGIAGDTPNDATPATPAAVTEPEMYSVYINYGETTYDIGRKLADIGLMESADAFVQLVETSNVATKLQAGNFIIPATATPEEVISYLTRY